jgi:cation:H+ antiporter
MFEAMFFNPYLIFIIGAVFLYFGSELLIDNSIIIAAKLNLSKIFIGSTIVALGTSLPEIVVSIIANINGNTNIAIGNIVGSNIANISLVLGIVLLFRSIYIGKDNKVIFHLLFLSLLTILFYFLLRNGSISVFSGLMLIFLFIIYMILSIIFFNDIKEEIDDVDSEFPIFKIIIGIVLIYFGSNLFIDGAIGISLKLGISDLIIGMTVVALGTSLPELIVSINSLLKKQVEVSIGNIIGSNIMNIVFAIGLSSIIKDMYFNYNNLAIYNNYMLLVTFLLVISLILFRKINKNFGLLFISIYFVFIYLNFYISN